MTLLSLPICTGLSKHLLLDTACQNIVSTANCEAHVYHINKPLFKVLDLWNFGITFTEE